MQSLCPSVHVSGFCPDHTWGSLPRKSTHLVTYLCIYLLMFNCKSHMERKAFFQNFDIYIGSGVLACMQTFFPRDLRLIREFCVCTLPRWVTAGADILKVPSASCYNPHLPEFSVFTWSRSEYSFGCFAGWQAFCPSSVYLSGSFSFIFSLSSSTVQWRVSWTENQTFCLRFGEFCHALMTSDLCGWLGNRYRVPRNSLWTPGRPAYIICPARAPLSVVVPVVV